MPKKPYLIKFLKENYIFTDFDKELYFVAESFLEENEQFS